MQALDKNEVNIVKHIKKRLLIISGVVFLIILVGPFLVPISSTKGLVSPDKLADSDSRFIELGDFNIHYKQYGEGEPTFILLHGTLADTYTWRKVVDSLAQYGTVIAYDRPPFGLTSRPMPDEWSSGSPYGYKAQVDLIIELMNEVNANQTILVGNSMGGAIAALTAQYYPERVKALILAAPAQDSHGVPGYVSLLLSTPQMRRLTPLLLRNKTEEFAMNVYNKSWHDPSNITQEDIDEYRKMFQLENWVRSLFEFIIAARPLEQLGVLREIVQNSRGTIRKNAAEILQKIGVSGWISLAWHFTHRTNRIDWVIRPLTCPGVS